jgi:hypothetical protein
MLWTLNWAGTNMKHIDGAPQLDDLVPHRPSLLLSRFLSLELTRSTILFIPVRSRESSIRTTKTRCPPRRSRRRHKAHLKTRPFNHSPSPHLPITQARPAVRHPAHIIRLRRPSLPPDHIVVMLPTALGPRLPASHSASLAGRAREDDGQLQCPARYLVRASPNWTTGTFFQTW